MANPFDEFGVSDAEFNRELESDRVLEARIELAEEVAQYWRRIAPVDTGDYRDSIHVVVRGDDVRVRADDEAAPYIEYGTEDTPEHAPRARVQAKFGSSQ